MKSLKKLIATAWFNNAVLIVIVINSIALGLETIPLVNNHLHSALHTIDIICIAIFVLEAALKLTALHYRYFKSGWNVFDFIIVLIALLPLGQMFSIFRALRIIRAFRLIEHIPSLKRVVAALAISIPGMLSTAVLILLVFFVFGVVTTQLYAASFPQWFGHLGRSMFSLFQIMTLESWSMGIVRPVMKIYPYAWAIFVPFILISAFILLNFLIGIVVDAIAHLKQQEGQASEYAKIEAQLNAIQAQLEQLKKSS